MKLVREKSFKVVHKHK